MTSVRGCINPASGPMHGLIRLLLRRLQICDLQNLR
jgi:hypothetical protein